MYRYRLTKYDPQKRNGDGHFVAEDWTSVSDIGRTFGGKTLSQSAYLAVENAYVESLRTLLEAANITSLRVTDSEHRAATQSMPLDDGVLESCRYVQDGRMVSGAELENLVRACLREYLWCRLEGSNGAYVHFGYDYYMYVGVPQPAQALVLSSGMFLEEFESPYMTLDD